MSETVATVYCAFIIAGLVQNGFHVAHVFAHLFTHFLHETRLLADDGRIVSGHLRKDEDAVCFCDAENLEILLRMQRAAARPALEPRPLTALPGYLASYQRIGTEPAPSAVLDTLDRLRGYEAPVSAWLDDFLPARHVALEDHHVDAALSASSVPWLGCGREAVTFVPAEEAGLLATPAAHVIDAAFRDPLARYPFQQLADRMGQGLAAASALLWYAAWSGAVTADTVPRKNYLIVNSIPLSKITTKPKRSRNLNLSKGPKIFFSASFRTAQSLSRISLRETKASMS